MSISEDQEWFLLSKRMRKECEKNAKECERMQRRIAAIKAERDQLQAEVAERRRIGGRLANVAYNLTQQEETALSAAQAAVLNHLRKEWDAIRPAAEGESDDGHN